MNNDLQVSQSVEINASPAKVWHGLITPEIIAKYLFGTETITDWKIGSDIIFQGEYQGHKYKDKGIVLEFVPEKKLSYLYWSGFSGLEDKRENYATVTCTIEDSGNNKTIFTWTQRGFANETGYQHSLNGMASFLQSIKEVMEK
ncbi:MAG: SRPBCC family protein [Bacteroidia bacterium]